MSYQTLHSSLDYPTPKSKKACKSFPAATRSGYRVELARGYTRSVRDTGCHEKKANCLIENLTLGDDSQFYLFPLDGVDSSNIFEARVTKNFRLLALKIRAPSRKQVGLIRLFAICSHKKARDVALQSMSNLRRVRTFSKQELLSGCSISIKPN